MPRDQTPDENEEVIVKIIGHFFASQVRLLLRLLSPPQVQTSRCPPYDSILFPSFSRWLREELLVSQQLSPVVVVLKLKIGSISVKHTSGHPGLP